MMSLSDVKQAEIIEAFKSILVGLGRSFFVCLFIRLNCS